MENVKKQVKYYIPCLEQRIMWINTEALRNMLKKAKYASISLSPLNLDILQSYFKPSYLEMTKEHKVSPTETINLLLMNYSKKRNL